MVASIIYLALVLTVYIPSAYSQEDVPFPKAYQVLAPSLTKGYGQMTFAPGLRTLTLHDDEAEAAYIARNTPRAKFLKRLYAGLAAERPIRLQFKERREELAQAELDDDGRGGGYLEEMEWRERLEIQRRRLKEEEERQCNAVFDNAWKSVVDDPMPPKSKNYAEKKKNQYQFVGVVSQPEGGDGSSSGDSEEAVVMDGLAPKGTVKWYARKKPKNADWSVRMVHVDRAAIMHDLFLKQKIDVYGEYRNTGAVDEETGKPLIEPVYTARERSWKTLWNVNLKNVFLDRSGHKFRERRLLGGLYTDGAKVFENSYDYDNGRNGMKTISNNLKAFLARDDCPVDGVAKEKLEKKLKTGGPDVVVEF
mmetsp:Transcript_46317/g.68332  ORF Transcript_46317/g.68332 Transcript_46317/m.68332 type:complete len:364 (+) Transcript_46317:174-1265(+)|eukprot:CAMPEP_0195521894 /NCGR_PEP_ID=MMETSP0794_2-20130614/19619_1 /TAXON_ID=515487 /ORGANISM="Stephanopyxis turris, Strain CCMP 815" /LENGTH=363 /DNA_ID=CAMNT_0040651537 /DNA_START=171 /DNA_END=1262 /DNA_ORIENTATION=-